MSRLRKQFKTMPKIRNSNDYDLGGFVQDVLNTFTKAVKWTVNTAKSIARQIVDATGGDEGPIAGILRALIDKGADDDQVGDILKQLALLQGGDYSKSEGIAANLEIGELSESIGFMGPKPVLASDVRPTNMPGTGQVNGMNSVDFRRLSSENTIYNPLQYMTKSEYIKGPRGPNIKIGT